MVTFFTYDDRFHIGMTVDKATNLSREDAQEICDGIFREINIRNNEISVQLTEQQVGNIHVMKCSFQSVIFSISLISVQLNA